KRDWSSDVCSSDLYHTISFNNENKDIVICAQTIWKRNIFFNILNRSDGYSSRYLPDNRGIMDISSRNVIVCSYTQYFNCPWFSRISSYVSLVLQSIQVPVYSGAGSWVDSFWDFSYIWWISFFFYFIFFDIIYLLFMFV